MRKFGILLFIVVLLPASVLASEDNLQQQLSQLQQSLTRSQSSAASASANSSTNQPAVFTPSGNNTAVLAPSSNQAASFNAANQSASQVAAALPNQVATQQTVQRPSTGFISGDVNNEAFGRMTQTLLPLTPEQIKILHLLYSANQRAASQYPGVPPKPVSTSVIANLSPGATPPVVRLGAGFVTALVFLDSSGAPWPVASYSLGNPQAFNIQWDKTSNILLVQGITAYRRGNIAVLLKGLNTPVMLEFVPGQSAMDVRVDVRVPGLGPNGQASVAGLPGVESPYLLNLLDGVPPKGSEQLTSSLCNNCVWQYKGKMYLRTRMTVLSPAWISTMSSVDGTHVYEMQPTPVVLVSRDGKVITMTVQGF